MTFDRLGESDLTYLKILKHQCDKDVVIVHNKSDLFLQGIYEELTNSRNISQFDERKEQFREDIIHRYTNALQWESARGPIFALSSGVYQRNHPKCLIFELDEVKFLNHLQELAIGRNNRITLNRENETPGTERRRNSKNAIQTGMYNKRKSFTIPGVNYLALSGSVICIAIRQESCLRTVRLSNT